MKHSRSTRSATTTAVAAIVAVALGPGACTRGESLPSPPATTESPASAPATERVVGPLTAADAEALATMNERLKAYVALHIALERTLPRLPDAATPDQIDKHQRAFEALMRDARSAARPGDIFTVEARPVIVRLLATVFSGPDGRRLRSSVMDENWVDPVALKLEVNGRYPDVVPLTSMPADVLQTLPKLSEDLEYRFIGDWLILLDTHAHVIADFIDNAIPKAQG